MDFGFTNKLEDLEAARQWVADAVADGWTIKPTYRTESVERAASLTRDGYKALVLMRDDSNDVNRGFDYTAQVSLWGPDGLVIKAPFVYDFALIQKALRECGECSASDVDTQRVGFAGRSCVACLPKARKKYEYPGWTR